MATMYDDVPDNFAEAIHKALAHRSQAMSGERQYQVKRHIQDAVAGIYDQLKPVPKDRQEFEERLAELMKPDAGDLAGLRVQAEVEAAEYLGASAATMRRWKQGAESS